jgi:hypothetical protein
VNGKTPQVAVTRHAIERLRARSADLRYPDATHIRLEVAAALRESRVASNPPSWLPGRRRRAKQRASGIRFAWDAGERRYYVLKKQRSADRRLRYQPSFEAGRQLWVVLTVVVAGDEDDRPPATEHAPQAARAVA